jgi:hypothetical protein
VVIRLRDLDVRHVDDPGYELAARRCSYGTDAGQTAHQS